ncbi:MAG: hypothetical protein KGZ65_07315 [Sphingomonadales bacterium]|nr:hypothetical protein [Sphingomonadaceae bacterium]MBS3931027.1 hypothetical protein [Sphingomonadales bacterium]
MSKRFVAAAVLPLTVLALLPASAMARERPSDTAEMARELEDPRNQRAAANAMGALFEVMLGMKAAPLAKAMDAMGERDAARRIPRGATIGDLAGPEARAMPREIKRRVPGMMTAMASMTGMLDEMMPQLEAIGKQMERDFGRAD